MRYSYRTDGADCWPSFNTEFTATLVWHTKLDCKIQIAIYDVFGLQASIYCGPESRHLIHKFLATHLVVLKVQ